MKITLLLLFISLLAACTRVPSESQLQFSTNELHQVIISNSIHPVIVYPEPNEIQMMGMLAESRAYTDAGDTEAAVSSYEGAASLARALDGQDSKMLLSIYDELIKLQMTLGNIQQADQLQHEYHAIIKAHYGDNNVAMRDATFRLGCWHSMVGDWYEALFDFEEVIKNFSSDQALKSNEHRQLNHAKRLADIAANNCVPNW